MELLRQEQSDKYYFRAKTIFSEKIEALVPMFTGVPLTLIFCVFLAVNVFNLRTEYPEAVHEEHEEIVVTGEQSAAGSLFISVKEKTPDLVLEYYQNPEYSQWVIDFFTGVCSDNEIARIILKYAGEFDVPAALAFALCWEESRFKYNAVNSYNLNGSIDRGLFQLNSRSFPHLEVIDFYNMDKNAYYGVSHLKHCLNSADSEVSALAMYNAGTGRVKSSGTPYSTLNYVSRILDNRSKIESQFHSMLIKEEERRLQTAN